MLFDLFVLKKFKSDEGGNVISEINESWPPGKDVQFGLIPGKWKKITQKKPGARQERCGRWKTLSLSSPLLSRCSDIPHE